MQTNLPIYVVLLLMTVVMATTVYCVLMTVVMATTVYCILMTVVMATTVYCILMTVVRSGYDCVLYTDDCCPQWLRLCIVY